MFIRPGRSHFPWARITRALSGTGVVDAGPTAAIRSPSTTTTASGMDGPPSRLTTVAPTIAVTGA
jgi:hypothetical protein